MALFSTTFTLKHVNFLEIYLEKVIKRELIMENILILALKSEERARICLRLLLQSQASNFSTP